MVSFGCLSRLDSKTFVLKTLTDVTSVLSRNLRAPDYAFQLNVVPINRWEGGLEGIPAAMEYMKAGRVSALKLVFTI